MKVLIPAMALVLTGCYDQLIPVIPEQGDRYERETDNCYKAWTYSELNGWEVTLNICWSTE